MMIPVQKDEWLFTQYNEKSISQFRKFGQDKESGPESGHFVILQETDESEWIDPSTRVNVRIASNQ